MRPRCLVALEIRVLLVPVGVVVTVEMETVSAAEVGLERAGLPADPEC
jgi:hypothetical protein